MKKQIFSKIIFLLTLLAVYAPSIKAGAEEIQAGLTVNVDYSGELIAVEYQSPLNYDTYVNVYMIEKSGGGYIDDFSKIIRFEQVQCKRNGICTVTIKLGDDLNGYYDIFAVPGGVQSSAASVKYTDGIYILGAGARTELLDKINSSSEAEIGGIIFDNLKYALAFEETSCPEWKSAYMYSMKLEDCGGFYENFGQIAYAWSCADYIYSIRTSEQTEGRKAAIEKSGDFLDIENSDYVSYSTEFITMLAERLEKNNVMSHTAIEKQFAETALLTALNNRELEGKTKALEEYDSVLKLSDTAKRNLSSAGAVNVLRYIGSKSFGSVEAFAAELTEAAAKLATGGTGGGSGSGGTGGGTKTVNVPAWSDGVSEQAQPGQGRFTDVPVSHWAAEAIEFLAEKSIISGYEGGVFKPDNNITREEFIKLAVDAFNISVSERTELSFNDVSETHWATEYIKSGLGAGVIKGISANEFGLGRPITRQDMAVIMLNCLRYDGVNIDKEAEARFADNAEIAEYAADAVCKMSSMGIINGFEDGTFQPRGLLTRAQAAQVIYGCLKLL